MLRSTIALFIILYGIPAYSQCTWHTFIYDGFEYTTTIPGLVSGTTTHNTPQTFAVHSGSKSAYLNFVTGLAPGTLVYNRQIFTCPNVPLNISAYLTTSFGGVQCDVKIQIVDANNVVLASLDTLKPDYAPTWSLYQSGSITPTTTSINFKLYTNNGGSAGGNDLSFDDFKVEQCHTLNLGSDTTICNTDVDTIDAGTGFQTYLWNTNSTNHFVVAATSAPGNSTLAYAVTVWDVNGCQFKDTAIVNFVVCSSVNDADNTREFSVSLNAATKYMNVNSNIELKKITIYSLNGEMAKEFTEQRSVYIGDLPDGVYIVKGETINGKQLYSKIIVN
jgi:hypothetical protein